MEDVNLVGWLGAPAGTNNEMRSSSKWKRLAAILGAADLEAAITLKSRPWIGNNIEIYDKVGDKIGKDDIGMQIDSTGSTDAEDSSQVEMWTRWRQKELNWSDLGCGVQRPTLVGSYLRRLPTAGPDATLHGSSYHGH